MSHHGREGTDCTTCGSLNHDSSDCYQRYRAIPVNQPETERNWDIDLSGLAETEVEFMTPGSGIRLPGMWVRNEDLDDKKEDEELDPITQRGYIPSDAE